MQSASIIHMKQDIIEYLQLSEQVREIHRSIRERLTEHDLTPQEAAAICVIDESSCSYLADRLGIVLPRVTTLVKNLKYRGLVIVRKKGTTHIVNLTDQGKELLNKIGEL